MLRGRRRRFAMARYRNYVMAQSLDEAYELNQKKSNVIVAGNMWLRMCGMNKQTAVDLSLLGLDGIEETDDAFVIGSMTTLRTLETSAALGSAFGAQLYAYMRKQMDFEDLLRNGDITTIREYLREHVHQYGKLKNSRQMLKDITGEDFNPQYYIDYLKEKYSAVYGL